MTRYSSCEELASRFLCEFSVSSKDIWKVEVGVVETEEVPSSNAAVIPGFPNFSLQLSFFKDRDAGWLFNTEVFVMDVLRLPSKQRTQLAVDVLALPSGTSCSARFAGLGDFPGMLNKVCCRDALAGSLLSGVLAGGLEEYIAIPCAVSAWTYH
eukprot:CAMPEP_0171110846 /NCGR_PEP_ID=MMETSP0766_2-20121228/72781_1 /TAXON_ID=439317 /ORGANISM="Gambierdiscus australes, Strain CAWD 149" /LENGTH=153 /DNA_ID=CAMNT_0011572769 /DNA_START=69 /DNA_END=530 /DNA_ORIENTATION=+